MKAASAIVLLSLLTGFVPVSWSAEEGKGKSKVVYSADSYDPAGDAGKDFSLSKKIAARDGRHIMLLVGGDWCPYCRRLAKFIEENGAVASVLAAGYVVQKVVVDDEVSNSVFLNPFPAMPAFPHVFLLDGNGRLLQSIDTESFETRGGYDEMRWLSVLKEHAPAVQKR